MTDYEQTNLSQWDYFRPLIRSSQDLQSLWGESGTPVLHQRVKYEKAFLVSGLQIMSHHPGAAGSQLSPGGSVSAQPEHWQSSVSTLHVQWDTSLLTWRRIQSEKHVGQWISGYPGACAQTRAHAHADASYAQTSRSFFLPVNTLHQYEFIITDKHDVWRDFKGQHILLTELLRSYSDAFTSYFFWFHFEIHDGSSSRFVRVHEDWRQKNKPNIRTPNTQHPQDSQSRMERYTHRWMLSLSLSCEH